jgi:hypothetical protein
MRSNLDSARRTVRPAGRGDNGLVAELGFAFAASPPDGTFDEDRHPAIGAVNSVAPIRSGRLLVGSMW